MTIEMFIGAFLFGAAAIAVWMDARYPSARPEAMRRVIIHLACATLLAQFLLPQALSLAPAIYAVMLIALPILVYVLVAAIWFIRYLAQMLPSNGPTSGLTARG
jgi:hypothetical protein